MLLKPVFPVIDYIVNYEYISKVLCVNKAKLKLQCNGKCHLMKELAKTSENEAPVSSDKSWLPNNLKSCFWKKSNHSKLHLFIFSKPKKYTAIILIYTFV